MIDALKLVREWMIKHCLDYLVLPSHNEFMYVENSVNNKTKIQLICGFTGSNGTLIISQQNTALLTDGRYLLQASKQTNCDFIIDVAQQNLLSYLLSLADSQSPSIGLIAKLHTYYDVKNMMESFATKGKGKTLKLIDYQELEAIIGSGSALDLNGKRTFFDVSDYAGKSTAEKTELILSQMSPKAEAMIISDAASLCWLLNIRGRDDDFTPLFYGYGVLSRSTGKCHLIETGDILLSFVREQFRQPKNLQLDVHNMNFFLVQQILKAGHQVVETANPILINKSVKNDKEISGMRSAHQRDGAAVVNLLCWLEERVAQSFSEIQIAEQIYHYRKEQAQFICESFQSIVGSGANGAIIHYHADASNGGHHPIQIPGILLIDSGGQYYDGTTDITRTIALGQLREGSIKRHFSLVLKGHIALARAIFPKGTTGAQLDCLARQFLWQDGKDYPHATGHGVGYCSCVHEGPANISARSTKSAILPNMIISNEPGFYLKGQYGIRIESLMLVKPVKDSEFLQFETITMAPIDKSLIEIELLDQAEIDWINSYHAKVYDALAPLLNNKVKSWLKNATASL